MNVNHVDVVDVVEVNFNLEVSNDFVEMEDIYENSNESMIVKLIISVGQVG